MYISFFLISLISVFFFHFTVKNLPLSFYWIFIHFNCNIFFLFVFLLNILSLFSNIYCLSFSFIFYILTQSFFLNLHLFYRKISVHFLLCVPFFISPLVPVFSILAAFHFSSVFSLEHNQFFTLFFSFMLLSFKTFNFFILHFHFIYDHLYNLCCLLSLFLICLGKEVVKWLLITVTG